MSHPQLDSLVRIGKLKIEPAAESELRGLVRSGIRRLDDAAREDLSLESPFDLAYNAAHALALAATALTLAIWSFSASSTRSTCPRSNGACSTRLTASAISPSTKARWM